MLLIFERSVTPLVTCSGADLSNAVTTLNGDNTIYAKLNHKNSELALTFNSFIMTIVVFGLQKRLIIL